MNVNQDTNKMTAEDVYKMLVQVVKNGKPMSIELHHPGNSLDAFTPFIIKKRIETVNDL